MGKAAPRNSACSCQGDDLVQFAEWSARGVHTLMRCSLTGVDDRVQELPLVLDPDTGNGGSEL